MFHFRVGRMHCLHRENPPILHRCQALLDRQTFVRVVQLSSTRISLVLTVLYCTKVAGTAAEVSLSSRLFSISLVPACLQCTKAADTTTTARHENLSSRLVSTSSRRHEDHFDIRMSMIPPYRDYLCISPCQ